jgi:hypothetical protein
MAPPQSAHELVGANAGHHPSTSVADLPRTYMHTKTRPTLSVRDHARMDELQNTARPHTPESHHTKPNWCRQQRRSRPERQGPGPGQDRAEATDATTPGGQKSTVSSRRRRQDLGAWQRLPDPACSSTE